MLTVSTLYQQKRLKNLCSVTSTKDENKDERRKRRRKTKTSIKKRTVERRKLIFKTNVLVPKTKNVRRWRHRSGYTYLLFGEIVRAGLVMGRTGRDSPQRFYFTGKTHKIPQMSYLRRESRNAKHETRNTKHETPAIFRLQLIDSPKQMKQMKQKMQLSLRTD